MKLNEAKNKLERSSKSHDRRSPSASCRLPTAFCLLLSAFCFLPSAASAQTVADKMVASVTNGSRATPDLISYSDLVWQLALGTDRPFNEKPTSEDLNHALRLLEDQLLILQEARKLPLADTEQGRQDFDKAVAQKLTELTQAFGSRTKLEERMIRVGLTSDQLNAILRDRVTMEKYLEFRFRAFVLIGPTEITDRYNQEYARLRNSGRIVPTLDQARSQIEQELTDEKIASEIDTFVDSLREQPGTEIVIISPV
jgi:hypothetical protein